MNALVARLESDEALDGLGRPAGRTVRRLISDGTVKDALSGRWLGHPLHPILTDIPIGVWTSSVLLDWIGGKDSQSASDRLVLVGLLAAGATAASGWSDWADAEQAHVGIRRSGLVHAAVNATAVALMLGSYSARKRGLRGRGRLLSLAGSAALGTGGWLGGHLTYTLGAGVTTSAPPAETQPPEVAPVAEQPRCVADQHRPKRDPAGFCLHDSPGASETPTTVHRAAALGRRPASYLPRNNS